VAADRPSMQAAGRALSGRCRYHADRDGVGVCMRCRAVICSECSTRIDGINHCLRCLDLLRKDTATAGATRRQGPAQAILVVLLFGACTALVFLLTRTLGVP
jgi:hypothetical protein